MANKLACKTDKVDHTCREQYFRNKMRFYMYIFITINYF